METKSRIKLKEAKVQNAKGAGIGKSKGLELNFKER